MYFMQGILCSGSHGGSGNKLRLSAPKPSLTEGGSLLGLGKITPSMACHMSGLLKATTPVSTSFTTFTPFLA
jgi:hypothetical protein